MTFYQDYCTKVMKLTDSINLLESASSALPSDIEVVQEDLKYIIEGLNEELNSLKETVYFSENGTDTVSSEENLQTLYVLSVKDGLHEVY